MNLTRHGINFKFAGNELSMPNGVISRYYIIANWADYPLIISYNLLVSIVTTVELGQ